MAEVLKRLYSLNKHDSAISFIRRGTEYSIELENTNLVDAFPYLQSRIPLENIERITGAKVQDLINLKNGLQQENLIEEPRDGDILSGEEFYAVFREVLPDWMQEGFSSSYWDIMLSGNGSKQLYIGYLLELYHYTKNANRHMPLIVANCPPELKKIKRLLAMHYFEECHHYGFFARALLALGVSKSDVENSDPLPSTLAMSNFMRQAARTAPLAYTICSAILEGTTEDSGSYGEYFKKIAPLYNIPDEAIQPVFDHLALDAEYGHKSLFEDICKQFPKISRHEAEQAMSFGRQMIDHIYLWTDHIYQYYSKPNTSVVRHKFNLIKD